MLFRTSSYIPYSHRFVKASGYKEIRGWAEVDAENKIGVPD